jgi:hypothetical protein
VAEELATFVAGFVIATGGPVGLSVVKVLSLPYLVPAPFVATIRKWYVVLALNPLMLALIACSAFPVRVCMGVLNP